MKKIILGLILFLFLGNFSFAEEKIDNILIDNIKILKTNLLNSKYKNYLPKIDKLVEKINLSKLKEIELKLEKINENASKFEKIKYLIIYLKAKIKLEIYERENN